MTSHLSDDLLVRSIDEELSGTETLQVESHLTGCVECKHRYTAFRNTSARFEALAGTAPETSDVSGRERLVMALDSRKLPAARITPKKVMRRFGWAMAMAASTAMLVLLLPHGRTTSSTVSPTRSALAQSSTIDVDGESFITLPYSNPDLPVNSARVVQMQVSASSLADAGIVLEPISNGSVADRSVLADVLMGIDGQPLGVHVLSVD